MAKKEIDKKALNAEISKAMMNDFERVGMGFVTYWKLIACAAVGLAVLIAAICWAASYQRSSAKNAREALSGARTADELAAALASYGSSPAAPAAHFRLAGLYLQDKKFDKALEELKLAEGGSDPYTAGNIAITEGYVLELSGKLDDAAAKFAAAAGDTALPAPIRAEARFAAGRLYAQQKQLDRAIALLSAAGSPEDMRSVTATWDEFSASLLRAINAGEYGPLKPAEPKL